MHAFCQIEHPFLEFIGDVTRLRKSELDVSRIESVHALTAVVIVPLDRLGLRESSNPPAATRRLESDPLSAPWTRLGRSVLGLETR